MDIIVRQPYLILKSFELRDLPDFIVLTGENGTGKTQLLSYMHNTSRINYDSLPKYHYDPYADESMKQHMISAWQDEVRMSLDMIKMENNPSNPITLSESVIGFNEDGTSFILPIAEIISEGKHLTNIIYRDIQTPFVDLGNNFNKNSLLNQGEQITQKFVFYKTHLNLYKDSNININTINQKYLETLGFRKSPNSYENKNVAFPSFNEQDINIIKRIIEIHDNADPYLIPYYYIAYQPIPNSTIFSANLKFLFIQYWARKKAGLELGEAPWETFNKISKSANFRYLLDIPDIDNDKYSFDIKLRDKDTGIIIDADSLSSGEKVILSLVLAIYSSNTGAPAPEAILFDEPDAYLHPSLCKQMLDVIQEVLVKENGITVIMTTHSPTTVALSPEIGLFRMDRKSGSMQKADKREAIRSLTSGLNSISVFYENIKQIFVESSFDKFYLEQVYDLVQNEHLEQDIVLHFLTIGSDQKDGGCDTLKGIVKSLSSSPNSTVYGVIDWDCKNTNSDRIKVLGNCQRYAIDNYVFDPIGVAVLILSENYDIERVGFEKNDTLIKFKEKAESQIQHIINQIIIELEKNITETNIDKEGYKYMTVNCMNFSIPKWFIIMQGHSLVDLYVKTFPFLKKHKNLGRKIIEIGYRNFPEFIPIDIVETLKSIQETE